MMAAEQKPELPAKQIARNSLVHLSRIKLGSSGVIYGPWLDDLMALCREIAQADEPPASDHV